MAVTKLPALIIKGALGAFHERMASIPEIWPDHFMHVPSTTKTETYAWPGRIPIPRVFENARSIQGMRDVKFDITNITYELTMLIDLEDFEDDQTGTITQRFQELAEVFGTYKDQLFATLLEAGPTTIPPIGSDSDVTADFFYDDTISFGSSGTIDNLATSNITLTAINTSAEFLTALNADRVLMANYKDDQGRAGYNALAMTRPVVITSMGHDKGIREALNSTLLGGGNTNVDQGLVTHQILPYLANTDEFYLNLLGATRKPFIYQQRTPLEIEIDLSKEGMIERNGVLVMCRERFVMQYGDPRRSLQHTYT